MRDTIFKYIKKKYKVTPEYPWKRDADSAVFRHADNRKWFALVMNVARVKLGLDGEEPVDVINLKIDDPFFRDVLLHQGASRPAGRRSAKSAQKRSGILPAYHMSKQHWVTVLLDGTVPEEQVLDLIDMSFQATASAKKKEKIRGPKEWIVPANPKYYDVLHAFDAEAEINWKQGAGIKTGDTVYMYVAAPVSAILYQCKVTETDIPCDYHDENLTVKALMGIRLEKRFDPEQFPFAVLKEDYGIFAVRGPRGVPHSLSEALKRS